MVLPENYSVMQDSFCIGVSTGIKRPKSSGNRWRTHVLFAKLFRTYSYICASALIILDFLNSHWTIFFFQLKIMCTQSKIIDVLFKVCNRLLVLHMWMHIFLPQRRGHWTIMFMYLSQNLTHSMSAYYIFTHTHTHVTNIPSTPLLSQSVSYRKYVIISIAILKSSYTNETCEVLLYSKALSLVSSSSRVTHANEVNKNP